VHYDGASDPAISAPLGHFFGNGTTRNAHFQSRFVVITAGGYFAFLPMPFARSCRVTVENRHPTKAVRWFFGAIGHCALPELAADVGYLHTQFRQRTFSASDRVNGTNVPNDPHIVLDVEDGPGRFVGQTLTIFSSTSVVARAQVDHIQRRLFCRTCRARRIASGTERTAQSMRVRAIARRYT
jgi:hypothetical protein